MSTHPNESLRVGDVMLTGDRFPVIGETVMLKEALEQMSESRLGIVCITDGAEHLMGVLTDGDIRRTLLSVQKPLSALLVDDAVNHSIRAPLTARPTDTLLEAVELMGKKRVWDLPVVDEAGRLVGLLHLHPAVQALMGTGVRPA